MKPWKVLQARYLFHECESCYLLLDSHSTPEFLTDDILDEVKLSLIDWGIYHDSLKVLQEAVTDSAVAAELNLHLEEIVHEIHVEGIARCVTDELRLDFENIEGKKKVATHFRQHGDPPDKANEMAMKWYRQVFSHYLRQSLRPY